MLFIICLIVLLDLAHHLVVKEDLLDKGCWPVALVLKGLGVIHGDWLAGGGLGHQGFK